jgi:hypothetical protein
VLPVNVHVQPAEHFANLLSDCTVQEHFIVYCLCGEGVKLFGPVVSPESLIWSCKDMQNCSFRRSAEIFFFVGEVR